MIATRRAKGYREKNPMKRREDHGAALAAAITRAASKQSFYTIRFLVDRDRVGAAYRAYAYFRWLDDWLDQGEREPVERLAFVRRQRQLVARLYQGERPAGLDAHEQLLADLIAGDEEPDSGLQMYIRYLMAVMLFDAGRRGRLLWRDELAQYSRWLATAVTEALHYFIGHDQAAPRGPRRYLAATGAHIAHMLRDTAEDVAAGYYNAPRELLERHAIGPQEIDSRTYRHWVKERVRLARACFAAGREHLAGVENGRCRLAGYAYMARFEGVLATIEADGFRLRPSYGDRRPVAARLVTLPGLLWPAWRRRPSAESAGPALELPG
jgi:phytoene/squalene synthetase